MFMYLGDNEMENKEAIGDEIKRSLREVGVLSHIMPTVISQLTAVIVNAAADAAAGVCILTAGESHERHNYVKTRWI